MTSVWFSPSNYYQRAAQHIEEIIFRLVQFIHMFLDIKKVKLSKFFPHNKYIIILSVNCIDNFIQQEVDILKLDCMNTNDPSV